MKQRLDQAMAVRGLAPTRSQAESYIRLGKVTVNSKTVTKSGLLVDSEDVIALYANEQYVSRAGLKLASVAQLFHVKFRGKIVLDVGSSTGGFTDYALQHGAQKVIAVDVGTDQLHPSLHGHSRIVLHEKTDIRDVWLNGENVKNKGQEADSRPVYIEAPDVIVADVSFISLRSILPHISCLMSSGTLLVVMVKPQFEAGASNIKHHGVIKNDRMRREV
ncbi:MAG: TlyA family RNA methyltransferase, partial [Candidatus Micrarchaeaceae archaeon]